MSAYHAGPRYSLHCEECEYSDQWNRSTGESIPEKCPDCEAPRNDDHLHPRNDRLVIFRYDSS